MNYKQLILATSITFFIATCGDSQKFSDENFMEKECSEKIKAKHNDLLGVPAIESIEDTEGLKLAMGKYADETKTVVTATFTTQTNDAQSCTCLFDEDNKFLSFLEDTYESNQKIIKPFELENVTNITENIPTEITVKGNLINAYKWTDLNGENILINSTKQTETKLTTSGYLYSIHYLKKGTNYELLVETQDNIELCDLDLTLKFKADPIIIDSDKNNIAEIIIVYTSACKGDISPSILKVLLHEGKTKYGLRGMEYLLLPPDDLLPNDFEYNKEAFIKSGKPLRTEYIEVGRYVNDHDFKSAPDSFLQEAKKHWVNNVYYDMR